MHAALLLSIGLSQYFIFKLGLSFPWSAGAWPVLLYLASLGFAAVLLGSLGIGYGLSALAQQLTMLSAAFLLLPHYSIYAVILLVVSIFVFCHTFGDRYRYLRIFLLAAWGVISIALFSAGVAPYAIAALHACLGAGLITRSIIYPELELGKKKSQ